MNQKADDSFNEYVTALIGGQLFGLPILRVQDVFAPERLTAVPLSPPEVAGVLNLRGRIVTLIDMRCRLGLGSRENGQQSMAIGVESRGESYGLLIDNVGEVLKLISRGNQIRATSMHAWQAYQPEFIGSIANYLWFSTSTVCSTSR
jgi:purine-binding chemotaxis protein CheW